MKTLRSVMLSALLVFTAFAAKAQVGIQTFNSTYTAASTGKYYSAHGAQGSPLEDNTYTYKFGTLSGTTNNILNFSSFGIGSSTYAYRNIPDAYVMIRRHDNALVSGVRQLLWYQGTSGAEITDPLFLRQPYQESMEIMFNGARGLNAGTDNIFNNSADGNGNNNNIERFDYIIPGGYTIVAASQEGFIILDRGVLNAHDPFCVAGIKALNTSSDPSSYTSVLHCNSTHYGTVNPISVMYSYVLRKDPSDSKLEISTSTDAYQGVGGVFVRFSDLGLTNGQTIYGYSVFGGDFPDGASGSKVVDYNNTTYFPTNTEPVNGGLDMLAVSGVFQLSNALAPLANDVTRAPLCNPSGTGMTTFPALSATDLNSGGYIVSYKILTIPSPTAGILYYNSSGSTYTPVTAGQVLTLTQATTLKFDPADGYNDDAVFTYNATNNFGLYSNTAYGTVPVSTLPTVSAGPNRNICVGLSTILTATGASTYTWSPSTGLSCTACTSPTANPSTTKTYTITGTNEYGCVNTGTITVSVNPVPTVSVTSATSICYGSSTALSAGGAINYSWSPATGLSCTTCSNPTASPTTTTTYTVTGTNGAGCEDKKTVTVTVKSLPTLTISSGATICSGSSVGLSVSGASSYVWSPASGLTCTACATPTAMPTVTTTYTATGTGSNGCTNTASVTVSVNALPSVSAGTGVAICTGSSTVLSASGATTYSWSPATGLSCTTCASPTASPTSTKTYTVAGTSSGCTSVATVTVTVNALPTVTAGSSVAICAGSHAVLNAGGASTYSWSPSIGLSCTTCATTMASPSLTRTYTVTGTSSAGCVNTASVTVSVNALPTVSAGSNVTICEGSSTTLAASGASSYTWTPGATLSCTACASPSASPTATTIYTVVGTNGSGCTNTATVQVSVNPLAATIAGSANVCQGQTEGFTCGTSGGTWSSSNTAVGTISTSTGVFAGLTSGTTRISYILPTGCFTTKLVTVNPAVTASATSTNVSCNGGANGSIDLTPGGGTTPYTYSWSNGATTQDLSGLSAGTYSVTVTDAKGCTATASKTITQPATLTASAAGTNVNCNGGSNGTVTLIVGGGTTPYTYVWSNGATTQNLTGLSAGTYSVTVTDANGCTATASKTVTQPTTLTATTASTNALCYGCNNGTAGVTPAGGTSPYTYLWSTGATTSSVTGLTAGSYSVTVTDANGCTVVKTVTVTQPGAFSASAAGTNVNCYGGSNGTATLTVSGGTTPYTYSWSNGATTQNLTGLSAGTYSVVVTDAYSYTTTATVTITQPAVLAATATQTNVSCNGGANGSIDVTVTGGTTPYTYLWNGGATTQDRTGLSAGTYSVLVTDAKGCTTTVSKTITEPTTLTASATSTNVSCNGGANGSINLTPAGGTTPYAYSWSNGATTQDLSSLAAGTYSVTVTDVKGCTATTSKTISQPATLTASAAGTNVNCNGGSNGTVTLTVGGGTTPYTYVWSNGATTQNLTGLSAGTYSLTVTDANGCTATASKTITQPTTLTATTSSTNALCYGCANGTASVTPAGGTSPYTYLWSNGATTASVTGLVAGTYTVTVTDANGCTVVKTVTITQPEDFTVTITHTNVSCHDGTNGTADITVAGGTTPYTYSWSNGALTEDLSGLSAGTYSVVVTDAHGYTVTASATVTEPATLVATATQENVRCYGESNGSIDLSVTGGTTAYTYSWSTGATTQDITGLAAGTYSALVTDAHGCTATVTKTITQPTLLTATTSSTNALCYGCNNGTASVTPAGGTSPYTYLWSNGATTASVTGLVAGTYTVTVTDANGCTVVKTVTITQPEDFTITITQTNVSCHDGTNGTADITVAGGTTPYTYTWSNDAHTEDLSGLSAGAYSVVVTDAHGYTVTASATVTEPATLVATATQENVRCYGESNGSIDLSVTGGTTAYTYSWSTGETTQDITGLAAGTYSVLVTDAHGCTATVTKTITQPTLLTATTSSTNALCYGCANGTASVTPAGGTTAYTYLWSNGATTASVTGLVAGSYSVTVTDANGCTVVKTITITQPGAFTASAAGTNVNCFGGSNGTATLTVSGGTTPYTYLWSNGATTQNLTGLSAGTYSVVVTDAYSYTTTATVTITQPAVLAATATQTNVSCNGGANGAIDVTATGGTTPYTYLWNGGATTQDRTGLSAGTYSVLVTDAKGCTTTVSKTITEPATLTASATSVNVSCNGGANGSIDLTAAGGTTPYTYSWSNGATTQDLTSLAAGTYSVTVADAKGCTATTSKTITQPATLTASAAGTNVNCNGGINGTVTLTVGGGTTPYTYVWSNGATTQNLSSLSAGTYSVTVTDAKGCTATASKTITQPTTLTATTASTNALCYGCANGTASVTPAGGTTAYTYLWSNGATTASVTGLVSGSYSVTVTDANGCTVVKTITITQPGAFSASAAGTNVNCFGGSNGTATLTVSGGTTPYTYLWSNGATTQNLTGLSAGTYSVVVTDAYSYTTTATVTITQPAVLSATATRTNVSCNGGANGSIDVTVTGGTTPYAYLWNGGATTQDRTGLSAGTYSVLVTDAKGCTATVSKTITEPATLTASATSVNVSCNGGANGSIDLTAAGGTTPYTYSWSNGATTQDLSSLAAGTYSVTVTDAKGCTATTSKTITQPATLTASAAGTNVNCNGGNNGTVTLTVGGGTTPYTYVWSNGATTQNLSSLSAGTYSVTVTDAKGCTATASKTITQPTTLTATTASTNALCYGCANGTASVTPAGGTTAYTYLWSNGATTASVTGLVAGSYSVTVTDANGCTVVKTITITQPGAFSASAAGTNVNCFGGTNGTATLTVGGGTTPYTYLWSNGATTQNLSGLSAGTYSVIVTDAYSYTTTATVTITQPAVLAATATQTNVSCNGGANGSIDVTVTGGTTPYTYLWNGGATTQDRTGLSAGTYSVTVTDAKGCTATVSKTITEPATLTASATSVNVSCNGGANGSIDLTPAGGTTPYTYSWSNGATTQDLSSLAAGTYSVTVTDANGCTATTSKTITQPATLTASAAETNVNCNGGNNGTVTLTVGGGTTPYTYVWSNGATTQNLTGLSAGTYSVTVTDAKGCTATSSKTITQPTTLTATTASTNALCFGCANGTASVTAAGGTSAYTYLWSNGATTASVTGLVAGTYSVTVTDAHGCTVVKTVTITQPEALTVTITNTNVNCNGGSNGTTDITVAGGTTPYSYVWSNGAHTEDLSGLSAGTYSVVVTDANGYTVTASATVIEPATLVATATQENVRCYGESNGSIDLSVTGGTTAYSYSWNTGATTQDITGLAAGTYSVLVTDAHGCTSTVTKTITQPTILTATTASTNALCFGCANGTASVTPAGGTNAYTYLWSNGATTASVTGLVAGTYSVTVTDAHGCTVVKTVTITQPEEFTVTITNTNVNCHGGANGTTDITVAGGTTPYSYTWSNGAHTEDLSGLSAGTYSVVVTDAHGYTVTASATVTEPATLVATATLDNVRCYGESNGSIDLSVTGGTTAYAYSWSTGATTQDLSSLAAGTYSVLVTDAHGCTATVTKTITQPTILTATTSSTNALCFGCANGTASVTPAGGTSAYAYLWSNGATTASVTGLTAGTYSVTVTDAHGCTVVKTVTITQPEALTVTITNTNVNCNGGSNGTTDITVAGGTTPYSYTWNNGAHTEDLSGLSAGTYSVVVTDANGYTVTASATVTEPATLVATATQDNVRCYGESNGSIDLSVAGGTTAYSYSWNTGATTQDITGLAAGTYSVLVTDAHSCTTTVTKTITQPTILTATTSSTNALCFGCANGTASVTPAGGTSSYTYLWSNGATTASVTGLTAGTYSVTVTDAHGCTVVKTVTITQPEALTVTITNTNVNCNGGSNGTTDITVAGGTTPYSYTWSNGAHTEDLSGLSAGTYSVVVTDAHGYTVTASATVTEPATLVATATRENVRCYGESNGSIDLSVTGGTTAYSYSWNTGATTQDITGLAAGTYSVLVTDAHGCTSTVTKTITQPTILTATTASTNALCFGCANGTASVTPAGGTSAYTYLWSNGATTASVTGLTAGTYSVTVTDAHGCTVVKTVTITQPEALTVTITNTNVSCHDGSNGTTDITVAGGTTPYSYVWSNGAHTEDLSGLSAGTYSVVVTDANGYTVTASATVTEPATLVATATQDNVRCYGESNGSIDLSVTGGTTAYVYSWSTGATTQGIAGLAADTYSVLVTDAHGCTVTVTKTITQPTILTATTSSTNALCFGCANGTASVTPAGGTSAYTYLWSNGATTASVTGLVAGTYSVTVTDAHGCTVVKTVTITQPEALVVTITNTNVNCNGGSNGTTDITVAGGTTPYSYTWSNGAHTEDLSGLSAGTYSVVVTDAHGYTVTASATVTEPATLAATATQENVRCYGESNGSIDLSVAGGTTAYTYSWSTGATTQDITGLAAGTYSVLVTDAHGCTATVTRTITQPALLTATTSSTNALCYGCNNGTASVTPAGGTSLYTYLWSNGATTASVTGLVAGAYTVTVIDANGCTVVKTVTITQPEDFTITITNTNVSCHDGANGTADITVAGGTTPYTYTWSNGATTEDLSGLSAGAYSVVVTDAHGYTVTASATVTEPATLVATATQENVRCYGESNGSIDLSVTGGTTAYSYSWSTGATTQDITGLAAGTYSVLVTDAHGCTATVTRTVTQPTLLTATTSSTAALCYGCNNGTASVTPAGGTSPYTYLWSNGATTASVTGLVAGTYTVTVTDANGCTVVKTVTITQPEDFTVTITNTNVSCHDGTNGTADITVAGGTTPYTYTWSNGAHTEDLSGLSAGTYSVVVTDAHGYIVTASATVTEPTPMAITGTTNHIVCGCLHGMGEIYTDVTGGTAPYSYMWSDGATTSFDTGLWTGTYTVVVTDANGCTVSDAYSVVSPWALEVASTINHVSCNGGTNGSISLAVTGGIAPFTYSWSTGATTSSISGLVSGVYSVTVTDANGCARPEIFVVEEPATFELTGVATDAACAGVNNGSIDVTATGGTAPYTYSWSNGATSEDVAGLSAGAYSVTVTDAHSCTATASFSISAPAAMTISGTTNTVVCGCMHGMGEIYTEITGGTAPFTYLWSNGATTSFDTGLWTGTYSVTVTDANGCTISDAYSVISPVALVADGAVVNVSCPGGSDGAIAMTVSGGIAPYSFNWNTGSTASAVSGLTAGVYSVAVTDANGCAKPYIFVVEEPATIAATGTIADVTCYGGSNGAVDITVSGGTAPYTYSWSTGATSQDVSGLAAGTYSVSVTDAHGCSSVFAYTVSEDPLTAVTISGPSVVCVASAIPFTGSPAGGTWVSSTPAKATVTTTGVVTGIAIGTTRITYTSPAGCRSILVVTVNGAVPAITGPTNVCANQSITLANPMTGGIWTSANTAVAVVDSFSGVVTGVWGGTVNITYNASAGCYRAANIWIRALPQPITGLDTLCAGSYVQLYSSMGTTGTWSSSDPAVASVGLTTGFLTAVSTGTATVTYRLTASGCYVTRTQTTRLSPDPVTGPSNLCFGTNATMVSSPAGGTWMSSNNSVAMVGSSSGLVNAVANGGAIIRYTLPNGCYANRLMTVNPLPGVISGTLGICVGSSTTLTSSSSGCSWSSSNTAVATVTSSGVVTGVGMGTSTITVTNGFGCIRTAVVTVNVLGTNSGDAVVCIGQTTTLTNPTAGGTWSTSNSARATVNSSTGVVTGVSLGTVNISYRVGTCYSITTVTVNSNAYAIGGTASVCAGLTTTLTYPVAGGTWSSSNTARATVGETSGVVTGVAAGTATITYSITSSCFRTVVVTVETLSAEITGSSNVCAGSTSSLAIAATGGVWTSGNTSVATINATSGVVTGVVPGTATITYTGASGCYTTRTITVLAAPGAITGTTFVCAGQTISLSNATEGGSWISSNTSVATVSASGIVTGVGAGTVYIYYTLGAGCGTSVSVTVGAMPAEITGAASVCGGTTIMLSSATGGGSWTSSNTAVASVSSAGVVTGGVAGTATVTYMLSSGCYRTKVITVIPMPVVTPIIGEASAMCPGTSIALSNGTAGGSWSSSNTAVATVSGSGLVTGVVPGTAIISYSVSGDCGTTSVTRTVTVNGTPDPGTISGPNTMCVGSTVALHASVPGGLWIAGNPEIATTCPCNSGHVTGIAPGVAIMSYKVTNDCGEAYATYPVTVNAVPSVAPGLVTPVIAGATTASLPFTTTASPTLYSIVWGTTAASAGFTNVTGGTLTGSPLAVVVPATAAENTYMGRITVSTAYCSSVDQPFSITVNNSVNIYTYAGTGTNGYTGNGNAATLGKLSHPYNIATDCDGNTFIADFENAVIRKVSPTGVITTVAGNGSIGYSGDGGPATNARMSNPTGITLDAGGNVYFSDFNNHVVRRISTSGVIARVAGNLANGYSGDGGAATSARLKYPSGLAFDGAGNLYIADNGNHVIRKVTPAGIITTYAGTNIPGYTGDSAAATDARLNNPKNVHVDNVGNLYISDWGNQVVRKVDAGGMITTIAGNGITGYSGDGGAATAARLDHPYGITSDAAGNIYFSEYTNQVVRKVNPAGIISTIAGNHLIGYSGDGGPALLARLNQPMGLSRDCAGRIFIADNANYVVRILGEYNRVPYFPAGNVQNIDVCYGSGSVSMNTRLAVTDYDTLQPLTWTVVAAPAHGTLVAGYSATTTGATITPTGLSYTPASGYAGADVFVVRANDGIASAFTTVNVTVSTSPVAGVISGTSAICGSGTTHLTTTGTGGSWSSSNTSVAIVDAYGYVSGVGYGTSTISYTVVNSCGSAYATKVVTFNPMPYAGSIIGAAKVCRGSSITYISPVTGGYWSSGNTSIATVSSTGVVYGVDTGLTTISYTVSNVCGTAYGLRDVTVEILPTTSPITGPGSICAGASTTLYDATPHGAWYTSDSSIATIDIDNGTITGISAGTVLVSYRHNTSCGIVMVTTVFTVNPVTVTIPAIGGAGVVCQGSTMTLTNGLAGGTWSTSHYPVKFTVNSTTGVVTGVAAGTGVVTYTVPHDCGVSYVTRVLTVNPLPTVAAITGTSSICVGWTITASDVTPGGVWSSSNPSLATVNSMGVITGIAGGNPVISYSVTNSCGTAVATRLVPVGVPPAVSDITGPSVVCVGSTVTLGNSTTGGSWTTSDITHAAVSSAGIVTGVGEGTATISYSVHNGCGYSSTSKVLTVNPLPVVAAISGPSTVCVGTSITLANAAAGGVWSSSSPALATVSSTGVVSGISYGTATISYAVTNSCGTVVATKDVSVLVLAATATVSHVTTPGGTDGCILLSVVGGTMPYIFLWSNGATTQNLTGLTAGTYSVVVTDAVGETVTLTVTVNEVSARGVAAATEAGVMHGAHPNPFVSQTTIHFNLPVGKFATVDVFNAATGAKVATIYNDAINAGEEYTATLNGENLAAGVYIYRVSTEFGAYIGKVLLLK